MRRATEIDLALNERPDGMALQRWLYGELRAAILQGRLGPGARLPATRDLAARHGVSRGTVLGVFAQLAAEGYLSGAVGRGSFVASELPDGRFDAAPASEAPRLARRKAGARDTAKAEIGLSARGRLLARSAFAVDGRSFPSRAFRPSQPDLQSFPFALWARVAARRSRLLNRSMLADGEAQGYRPLREVIAEHVRVTRGIACAADHVAIVGSAQQVIDLAARLWLDPGDAAWMEDPGYQGARLVLEAAGARIAAVPVDAHGIDVAEGQRLAPAARLAYVTAGRQAPLGPALSLERRLALLDWAHTRGALVIEDDYDSEYRFEGRPLAALKSLDNAGHVIYCGTFSKLLFPALRIAYAVLPERLVEPFVAAWSLTGRHVPLDQQATLHAFIAEGHVGRHVRRMRELYGERAEALREAARRHWTGLLALPPIVAGLDAPAFLPVGADDALAARVAAQAGIETRPLSSYAVGHAAPAGLVLGFASIGVDDIDAGARTLARVLQAMLYKT
ncbi:PLP-dependent aminotransferase family protein [Paraburkholderia phymatum]|uniref:Transcriptional regulator, GntR family with aminotransferase domain n=1 Tax=Paraburkholderia phymatum (strain DSM 17167 / CIP 108236 / LMG 21445 / STM815) TaxID=391038 RepID=B2JNC1_PARP8|nr:PLP-dependent aminotransferase family protein [Paraburkholderia phymatum]ACC74423.1 transcriptional regulator, GntR family with aminotransferase domain [Paraburkholderia phymatum STM815]